MPAPRKLHASLCKQEAKSIVLGINKLSGAGVVELQKSEVVLHFSGALVGFEIFFRGILPAKLLPHAIQHQAPP